eukprot:4100456-Amphidinium_carterae.1
MSLRRSSRGTINIPSGGNVTFASYKDPSHGSGIAFATCAIDQSAVPMLQKLLHRSIGRKPLVVLTCQSSMLVKV